MTAKDARYLWWSPGEPRPEGEPARYVNGNKYVRLRWKLEPGVYIETWEHIWLAGEPGMDVHHLNRDGQDNTPGNLLVCTPEEHQAIHAAERRVDEFRIIALYEAGLSTPAVGRVVHCDASTVSRVLARNGKPARRKAWNRVDVDEAPILARLRAGDLVGRIASEIGCSRDLVDRVRVEHGLPPRRAGRPLDRR